MSLEVLLDNPDFARWALFATVAMLVLSLLLVVAVVAWLPADYFVSARRKGALAARDASPLRWLLMVIKNLAGLLLVLLGIVLLVLPGQGLLTILLGLVLLDFPGKYRLERWLVMRPGVHRVLDRFRALVGKPPFDELH